MLLLLGPHNIQFYNRGNIFVQNNTMQSDILGFGSSGKILGIDYAANSVIANIFTKIIAE